MTTEEVRTQIKHDIDPILDLFGGSDGGVGFAKLYHDFLPRLYSNDEEISQDTVVMIKQFSRLCKVMLGQQL